MYNNKYKDEGYKCCTNCKVWRWRFVEGNELVVGDWFDSAKEANDANQKHIDRTTKKEVDTTRINTSHAELIYKFTHVKKKAKKS